MLDALRIGERELFGSTKQRSRVVVLPAHGGTIARVLPDRKQWAGLRYLGYGLFEDTTPEAVITLAESLPPPAPKLPGLVAIDLRLGLRPLGPGDRITDAHRRLLGAAAWLWLRFGGIGARARRGWGSLGVESDRDGLLSSMPSFETDSAKSIIGSLLAGLDRATEIFRNDLPALGADLGPTGTKPHPAIRSIEGVETVTVLPGEHASPLEALDAAGRLFQGYRSSLERRRFRMAPLPDYFSVKTSLRDGTSARRVDRAAFGLPLPFYFRSLGGQKTQFVPDEEGADRLASPLLFRVHRVGGARQVRYVTSIVNLADRMDPMCGTGLRQTDPEGTVATRPDQGILKDFVAWAINQADRPRTGR
jgi:hypothetical protein